MRMVYSGDHVACLNQMDVFKIKNVIFWVLSVLCKNLGESIEFNKLQTS